MSERDDGGKGNPPMAIVFRQPTWEVDLPDEWVAVCDDGPAAICHPDGVGALQVSSFSKGSLVTDDDLLDFAREYSAADAQIYDLTCGDFQGIALTFVIDETYWRHWYLRCGQQMLFVTYNCSVGNRGIEDEEIELILTTLRDR